MLGRSSILLVLTLWTSSVTAWAPVNGACHNSQRQLTPSTVLRATPTKEEAKQSIEETTEKYGLEVGLLESLKQKDGGATAKSLLKRYGIAYLATSIPLALVSFAICYTLVDNGVDVGGLLSNVGIEVNQNTETAGTFAIAYAAHKAASPIRFPPTVLLTPVVAKLIGKEPDEQEE
ncbi:hypothetical protein FisN_36Lh030 [Fistulifera solaris]|uniref:DUF1279 domain-containing protein n=1 Tax=Fistulifera solaris TaxID=1519565 RepID=A0A1Z5JHK4_FISSO|nr:hypothetical protein FisN_36Lh030 [Fistulifera solaris]|eukprot:GAX13479.1 hypothetical protein FisN_36Lh030 [Fistulifera solaris]